MKHTIEAAELKFYNANNRGNNTGDCVKRGISLAFDIPYSDAGKLLNQKMKELKQVRWNITPVYRGVVSDLGGGQPIRYEGTITVNEFADKVARPGKIYLLETGKKPGEVSHVCCIRNGKVWDSWDSRKYYVDCFFEIDGSTRREIRDTDVKFMESMSTQYAEPAVQAEIERYAAKKGMDIKAYDLNAIGNDYRIKIACSLALAKNDLVQKDRYYQFDIFLVMEPTWTKEEIIEFIKKTAKARAYDRMYTINQEEKKLAEAAEVSKNVDKVVDKSDLYLTSQERRFINTLPGWVTPLIQHIMIEKPGQYSDSYMLRISPLPGDPRTHESILFTDWDANGIRYMLDRYKEDYSVEGKDYYKDW